MDFVSGRSIVIVFDFCFWSCWAVEKMWKYIGEMCVHFHVMCKTYVGFSISWGLESMLYVDKEETKLEN